MSDSFLDLIQPLPNKVCAVNIRIKVNSRTELSPTCNCTQVKLCGAAIENDTG